VFFYHFFHGRGENTMAQALTRREVHPLKTERAKQQIYVEIVDTFNRIPLTGVLIKSLSQRSLLALFNGKAPI
jgi:hypothetical protein